MFAHAANTDTASGPASDRNEGHSNNVTEQFKLMHVSANPEQCHRDIQELTKRIMSKVFNISENDPEYSQKFDNATRMFSQMSVQQQQQPTANQAAANGVPFAVPTSESSDTNESQRDRQPGRRNKSRGRSPMARFAKAAASGIRSLSPRRRQNVRSKSPIASQPQSNFDSNMSVDNDSVEFFEAHSTMDGFDSPNPKHAPKPFTANGNTPNASGRPPLATVHLPGMKNSSMPSPQTQESTFKFDKDQDKFNVGSSPPKKSKFGSPGKKTKSPSHRSSPASSSSNIPTNSTPLQGSPLTEGGSPLMTSVKRPQQQTGAVPAPFLSPLSENPSEKPQPQMAGAHVPFASPVPDVFHAPETFVSSAGRGIPTPQNILQNDQPSDATSHHQSAPAAMSAATAAAAASFLRPSAIPKTPFDPMVAGTPSVAPDTAETLIKKKTRNTATPNLGVASTSPAFRVDLSQNPNQKAKAKRGNSLRKGFNNNQTSSNANGRSTFVFGLETTAEVESPSNSSPKAMDTSPIFSPPLQHNPQQSQPGGINAQVQFSLGVGGGNKGRSRRKEVQRRGQVQKNQPTSMAGPSQSTFDLNHVQMVHEQKLEQIHKAIMEMKNLGKDCYRDERYQQATSIYSQAIEKFKFELFPHVSTKDLLAILLWNRAAALLMIGAYESAAEDCRNGILYVTDPRNTGTGANSPDMHPSLRPKLYFRMGRSFLKLGRLDDADRAFSEAIASATAIQVFYQRQNVVMPDSLEHVKTDGMMGQTDVSTLRELFNEIHAFEEERKCESRSTLFPLERAMKCLSTVRVAMNTANGCHHLHLKKVELLAELDRWREICTHCERFAASNVKYDGCLIGDLAAKNPFPGVPVAKYLRSNYFQNASEDDIKGIETTLDERSAAEAILRLPFSMMRYYLKSLRLNEKYHVEQECLTKLDAYIAERIEATRDRDSILCHFLWLAEERAKMERTKIERKIADDLFTNQDYRQAAFRYAECLIIDSGSLQNITGCRLHAVLHCNRAACFMMLHKFRDAMTECTNALRIYPRYVKALRRRARCYSRLERVRESINDYNHLLDMIKKGRDGKYDSVLTDLVFEDPQKVKAIDVESIKVEYNDVLEAKAKAEADERARQARNSYQEQSRKYHSERYRYKGNASPSHEDAHRRRENFYSSQNTSRSHSNRQEKPKPQKTRKDDYDYKGKSSQGGYKSQGSPKETDDHYTVLGIDRRATEDQIKKAYKKMALKYHPDKNKDDPSAAKKFLRIKDAYETLKDPHDRRKYDSQSRRRRY